jgi:hypothetical protein
MTEPQRKKLSKIIDLNWDISQEADIMKKFEMAKELSRMKKELRDNMGHEEYDTFMENGRKMFAPKTSAQ